MAYHHLLCCQPFSHWFDCTGEQSFVQWRRFRIAPLTFCHCNSACGYQSPSVDFQCGHLDCCHERCKLVHLRLDSNNSSSRCERYVRELIISHNANLYAGMAPKFLAYVDKKGRPTMVVILQLLFGCLAFVNLAENGGTVFTWLLSLSGLSILFIYGSIAVAHIRFRAAW